MKIFKVIALLLGGVLPMWTQAQTWWVEFSDKPSAPVFLFQPERMLSLRALQRLERQGLSPNHLDVPVEKAYLEAVADRGYRIKGRSRWMNAALVESVGFPADLADLPFVRSIRPVQSLRVALAETRTTFDYGSANDQIRLLNGDFLHLEGFSGTGMTIAVLDAGFVGADVMMAFDSLRTEGRLLGTKNFADSSSTVFAVNGTHGTSVLSTMAGLMPGTFVGTAPRANYFLVNTEVLASESRAEEYNWLLGAEWADSAGADVINSSLGYTTFDDTATSYSYADMDGNTTVVTRAADWAASRGILVVASAGNEGNSSWQFLSAPSDGDSVLAVGATNLLGGYASFSSRGPSSDGRLKPNVAGPGAAIRYVLTNDQVTSGSGTSFSSPIVAGLAACAWQAHPSRSAWEVMKAIEQSGSRFANPNDSVGYGIPNFDMVNFFLSTDQVANLRYGPNPARDFLSVWSQADGVAEMIDVRGRLMLRWDLWQNLPSSVDVSDWPSGVYFLRFTTPSGTSAARLLVE
ncbi:S8 family serine peptidase [bacterium]|nr:S8 family serine peptidase [bacterium]